MHALCLQIKAASRPRVFSGLALILLFCVEAFAHEGPPYPIVVDRAAGPYLISVWGDPDVGVGTFFVILEAPGNGTLPEKIEVELTVQPTSGRLAEAVHHAVRDGTVERVQYKAEVPFDREELWRLQLVVQSSLGRAEVITDVEVTPPGYGRWDLLIYLFPFVAIGLLWIRAILRERSRKRAAASR